MTTPYARSLIFVWYGEAFVRRANKALLFQTAAEFHWSVNCDFFDDFSSDDFVVSRLTCKYYGYRFVFTYEITFACNVVDFSIIVMRWKQFGVKLYIYKYYDYIRVHVFMHFGRVWIFNFVLGLFGFDAVITILWKFRLNVILNDYLFSLCCNSISPCKKNPVLVFDS